MQHSIWGEEERVVMDSGIRLEYIYMGSFPKAKAKKIKRCEAMNPKPFANFKKGEHAYHHTYKDCKERFVKATRA